MAAAGEGAPLPALNARLKPVWRRELRNISLGSGLDRKTALRLLSRDPGYLDGDEQGRLGALLASEERLMEALSAWCAKAAADGCAQMRTFAAELRAYS